MNIDRIVRKIVAESGGQEEYMKYFQKLLKKHGVSNPSELSEEEKKKFFNEVDKGWQADKETD